MCIRDSRYLTEFLSYDIGPEEKQGMVLFENLARKHGVLPAGPKAEITWC